MKQNPIPYYTLKQASKILNKKFNTDAYNTKSILSLALIYELKLYVLFSGDWCVTCDCLIPIELTNEEDENKKIYRKIILNIENFIESYIRNTALLKLNNMIIQTINCIKEVKVIPDNHIGDFDGFLGLEHLFFKEDDFNTISHVLLEYIYHGGELSISNEQVKSTKIFRIYPTIIFDEDKYKIKSKPKAEKFELDHPDNENIMYPVIRRKDILITHIQLEKILNGELKKSSMVFKPNSSVDIVNIDTNNRRGVSIAKGNAKLAAKTLAQYLWSKDTNQNIKLLEMAKTVCIELERTEHQPQLPSIESVKEWLKSIAPPYAKEAGRPPKTSG